MEFEALLIANLLLVALWPIATVIGSERHRKIITLAIALGAVTLGIATYLVASARQTAAAEAQAVIPVQQPSSGYLSSSSCRSCHPQQYATWHASYHRTMTQLATPLSVRGDFNDVQVVADGRVYKLYRDGEKFWVEMDDPRLSNVDPARVPRIRRRIALITGSHHMQVYWYETGRGRALGQLDVVWLIDDNRWIARSASFIQPTDREHGSGIGLWNSTCIACHATSGQPQTDFWTGPDTRVREFGIACEACHGPGGPHVAQNHNPLRRYRLHLDDTESDPTIVQPQKLSSHRASQVCAQCHSLFKIPAQEQHKFVNDGFSFRPGDALEETRLITHPSDTDLMERIRAVDPEYFENNFWSDGMVRITGREYMGLVASPCFQRAPQGEQLSCLSCHNMHQAADDPRPLKTWANDQLKRGMESNDACLQCHQDFATGIEQHTHHAPRSAGSLCYNCHMPHTTYGLLKGIRSHQIDSPSVDASLKTGRPNACNLCHLDKTLAWTADHLTSWYQQPVPQLSEEHRTVAAAVQWLLAGDAGQRALIASSMSWEPAQQASGTYWMPPYLAQLFLDPYDAVRLIARRTLRQMPGYEELASDSDGSTKTGDDTRRRAMEIWQQTMRQSAPPDEDRRAILIDADGMLMRRLFDQLLRRRDDRPLNLTE